MATQEFPNPFTTQQERDEDTLFSPESSSARNALSSSPDWCIMDPVTVDVSALTCYTFRTQVNADGSVAINQVAVDSLTHDIYGLQELHRSHPQQGVAIKQRLDEFLLARERVRLLLAPGMSQVVPILTQISNRLNNLEAMHTNLETVLGNHIRETNVQSSYFACMHNKKQLAQNGPFMPVVAWMGLNLGQRPASFPANTRGFNALNAAQVTTLLNFYGFANEDIQGAVERRERLLEIITLHR